MNSGRGIYYKCPHCHAVVYSFPMLKRLGFQDRLFTKFLAKAKQNNTKFNGLCSACGQPYREVEYDLNDYHSKLYVCPTCLTFAIPAMELAIFQKTVLPTEKTISPNTQAMMNELDEKLAADKKRWKEFDKSIKISKERSIGFFIFLFGLIACYSKAITKGIFPDTIQPLMAVISLIICIFAGVFILFGWKNIIEVIKQYLGNLRR